ncbi:glycosyltransferase [Leeuwenhoekiella marinoflava]|uniref:Glycosyltransferase involved in cell wall biosynthesis n=2 Tax=Leeuwenhoekiella marinoflava TaxID=988 RepID=A0A4Q0PII8_9FLAO|nr:glycosyltransferase [Leeuwenhoekiella marinoflava]RXG26912.1 glycosyltransferase involved in cell wall biosynthesis [Leeuwenhoekiella marinoflava]SHF40964.1 Glycosyltransferase involved in cell wall bisynthesis [Leeuwenhoekiella marinoflava DSM 3653]
MNIALFSPNRNPYSETFIQAQKERLGGKVYYYYGSGDSFRVEGEEKNIARLTLFQKFCERFLKKKTRLLRGANIVASLNQKRIDVTLIQYGNHAFDLLPVLKRADIPFVVHFHGYDASVKDVIKRANHYREVFERAAFVISVSKKMHQMLLELGCPSNKLILNTYGPNPIFFDVEPSCSKKTFISIGRFVDKKAPHLTIMAFAAALKVHPDAKLVMAGDGVLKNACFDLALALGCEESIEFTGVITPNDYRASLAQVRGFVQHSKTAQNGDMEGTPLAVLEAAAAGVPVISTFHAGIPDVVVNEQTGLLSEEGGVKTMTQHMIRLLDDKAFAQKLGAVGRKRIYDEFTMQRYISKLDEVLDEAANDI